MSSHSWLQREAQLLQQFEKDFEIHVTPATSQSDACPITLHFLESDWAEVTHIATGALFVYGWFDDYCGWTLSAIYNDALH